MIGFVCIVGFLLAFLARCTLSRRMFSTSWRISSRTSSKHGMGVFTSQDLYTLSDQFNDIFVNSSTARRINALSWRVRFP